MAEPKTPTSRMNVDQFMAWYDQQPDGMRYELLNGVVYPNEAQGERLIHAEIKTRVSEQLRAQIRAKKLSCQGFGDGMAVRIDSDTTLEPDASVRCGPRLPGDTIVIPDPLIVIEVVSPSSQRIDAVEKLTQYFRNPSILFYLIVLPTTRQAIRHRRGENGDISTSIHSSGVIEFDPPGLSLDLNELFDESGF